MLLTVLLDIITIIMSGDRVLWVVNMYMYKAAVSYFLDFTSLDPIDIDRHCVNLMYYLHVIIQH